MPLEFPNLPTLSATLTDVKMASQVQKAKCAQWLQESRSAVTVQSEFRAVFGKELSTKNVCLQVA
jgi:hypothetical protein